MALKIGQAFGFAFSGDELAPMLQMQRFIALENVLGTCLQGAVLAESITRKQGFEQAGISAQALAEKSRNNKGERDASSFYTISYYNPVLGSTEVLEAKSEITIKDATTKMIEESVAAHSAYPIYQYVATPLMRKEVLPWKLEEILSQREYGTPPPPPTGAGATPVRIIVQKESEIVAEKKRDDEAKEAVSEAIIRKETGELRLGEEIMLLEEAVASLRGGDDVDKVLARLPPLSRARFILALRKKNLGKEALINMLINDASFLKCTKKKLEMLTLEDLLGIYKMIRNLQKR